MMNPLELNGQRLPMLLAEKRAEERNALLQQIAAREKESAIEKRNKMAAVINSINNTTLEDTELTEARIRKLAEIKKTRAIVNHLDFISYTWQNRTDPFVIGYHTRVICDVIDKAIERYQEGVSSFYVIKVPFRHGKSEIISRKLPAHYLGLFPDGKVLVVGHTASLSVGYNKESRDLIKTVEYRTLFPNVSVNPNDSSASHWKINGRQGESFACGLGGAMAGQGFTLGLLDDYCRNRLDAESPTMRQNMWDSFTNDFMTRRAPISITIVLATPWHTDDIIGRIANEMKKNETFPKFEVITIPAFSDDYPNTIRDENGTVTCTGTLFPERFSRLWYDEQKATLGEYGTAALLQMNPVARGGNMLDISNIQRTPLHEFPENLHWWRVWDLAHTAKERNKSDPDYTSGTLLAFRIKPGTREWELWIKDVIRVRMAAPERDELIRRTAESDGAYVKIGVEDTIDSKDAFATLSKVFSGRRVIASAKGKGDKVMRMTPLEPIFKAGNVHLPTTGVWIADWIQEVSAFPSGAHDDMVDNLSAGYVLCVKAPGVTSTALMGV